MQHGAVQPHVYPKDLDRLRFIHADIKVMEYFEKILISYHDKIKANLSQIDILAKLRDTLLPKLMSGELRIPDAEQLVADI